MRETRPFTEDEITTLAAMWNAGALVEAMCEATNRAKSSICGLAKRRREQFPLRKVSRLTEAFSAPPVRVNAYHWRTLEGHAISLPVVRGYAEGAST